MIQLASHPVLMALLALPAWQGPAPQTGEKKSDQEARAEEAPEASSESAARRAGGAHAEEVMEILHSRSDRSERSREALAEQLADLGPEALPDLFGFLVGDLQAQAEEDGVEVAAIVDRPDELVFDALRKLPPADVTRYLGETATGDAPIGRRLVAMRVLGDMGDYSALDVWLRMLGELEPIHLHRTFVLEPSEKALASLLVGNRATLKALLEVLDEVEQPLLPVIARSLGRCGEPDALKALIRMTGVDVELDILVVDQIAKLADGVPAWRTEDSVSIVREYLEHDDWRMRRSAVAALGKLHDADSFPQVVELLRDENRRVRHSTVWALQQLSGLRWDTEEPEPWERWFGEQLTWYDEQVPLMRDRLTGTEPAEALAAVRDLGNRRLFRHDLSEILVLGLQHDRPEIVRETCRSLGSLQSQRAMEDLVETLRHDDPAARSAAAAALKSITGRDLAPDYEAWVVHLER